MGKNVKRAGGIFLLTFSISLGVSLIFETALAFWLSLLLLFLVIITGIIFDIVGTAVTAATEVPFHAMGADKVRGSKQAVYLLRHADRVANFCNDVIGDMAGTISGAIVAGLAAGFARHVRILPETFIGAAAIAFVAAVNVSGKALGKSFAIRQAHQIVFFVGKLLAFFKFFNPTNNKRRNPNNKSNSRKVRKV